MRGNKALADWLLPDPIDVGVWELRLPDTEPSLIAFDRATVDSSTRDVTLYTWGTQEAHALHRLLAAELAPSAKDPELGR
jgi:plasmid stabilization system protein ParE